MDDDVVDVMLANEKFNCIYLMMIFYHISRLSLGNSSGSGLKWSDYNGSNNCLSRERSLSLLTCGDMTVTGNASGTLYVVLLPLT